MHDNDILALRKRQTFAARNSKHSRLSQFRSDFSRLINSENYYLTSIEEKSHRIAASVMFAVERTVSEKNGSGKVFGVTQQIKRKNSSRPAVESDNVSPSPPTDPNSIKAVFNGNNPGKLHLVFCMLALFP
jgi:hypothetical protein